MNATNAGGMKRLLAGAIAGFAAVSGPAAAPDAASSDAAVAIEVFQYRPDSLVVASGTRVVWTNGDDIEHTVTAGTPEMADGSFSAALAGRGASVARVFDDPGTYPYFCARHAFMKARVVVRPGGRTKGAT